MDAHSFFNYDSGKCAARQMSCAASSSSSSSSSSSRTDRLLYVLDK